MPNNKIELQDLKIDSRYERLQKLAGKEFNKIREFINKAKNGENTRGVDISRATERKYIDALTMAYRNLGGKKLSYLTKEDLTELKQNLKDGKIRSRINRPYSIASQKEMEFVLIRFLEFLNPSKYSAFRKWFVVKVPRKSVDFLNENEVEKLFKSCKTNAERYMIAVLFDSGARASEFLNIRFEDIQKPTQSFPYYKIELKEEYSKTKGRNIGLYWKYSTQAITDYLKELDDNNPKAQVYSKSYDSIRIFFTRMGQKILGKRIHFHIFRKSSATFYATKLKSRQQLCYRYGWNFSSDVPDIYISRQQGEEEVKDNMLNTDLQKVEKENRELKTQMSINEEKGQKEIKELKEELATLKEQYSDIKESLLKRVTFSSKQITALIPNTLKKSDEKLDIGFPRKRPKTIEEASKLLSKTRK